MKRVATREYRFSDSDLIQITDDINGSANRDLTDLAAYGVSAAQLTNLMALRAAFSGQPTDEVLMGYIRIATAAKNETREELLRQIRQVTDRAKIKFGSKGPMYKIFAVEQLTKQRDAELVRVGERVVSVANEMLAELASEGLTQGIIDALEAKVSLLDDQLDTKLDKIKQRDIAVDDRIAAGNLLYDLLVTIAAKGKLCWIDTNEAKYNDYVLTETQSHSGQVVEGNVSGGDVTNLSVTGVIPTTMLTLINEGDVPLNFFFTDDPTNTTGSSVITMAPNSSQTASATALGFVVATMDRFNVYNTTTQVGSYRVEWE